MVKKENKYILRNILLQKFLEYIVIKGEMRISIYC